jgi:hypothetical protein
VADSDSVRYINFLTGSVFGQGLLAVKFWRKQVPCNLIYRYLDTVCFYSVSDPGSGAFFDPWILDPGWVKSQDPDPGSGMHNPDHIS